MKVLISGDSFAVDCSKYMDLTFKGWPNLLAETFDVTNVAQAGVSQYKILKQIQKTNLIEYDKIIVSITSPYRLFCRQHPLHKTGLHKNCDLIYNDISRFSLFNFRLNAARNWFKHYFDEEYSEDIYRLITNQIHLLLENKDYILISHNTCRIDGVDIDFDFKSVWENNKGNVNHYNQQGNNLVYKSLCNYINGDV